MTSSIIVANPVSLRWLDLSFNSITQIPEELANFTDVSVIYLHANSISNFKDLKVLSKFTGLRKLTLHGNPIEDQENYRMFITLLCPTLRMLDFSVITRQDLLSAKFYESAFKQKMKSRRWNFQHRRDILPLFMAFETHPSPKDPMGGKCLLEKAQRPAG